MLSAACSSSGDDGASPPADTTAPLVLGVSPHGGEVGVDLDHVIRVVFSEAMDPATTAGNVTLEPAAEVTLTWVADDTLEIGHDAWPEATEVTLTLGTGLADPGGNPLPAAHVSSFWTWTSEVRLLGSDPASGAVGLETNAGVVLQFSHAMNAPTLHGAITIEPPVADRTTEVVSETEFRIGAAAGWEPATDYTITVGTGAMTAHAPFQYLATPTSVAFTTGTTADTTPPTVVSTLPARGASGVATATNQAVITFSEPIDRDRFEPTRLGAHLYIWVAGEPQWSADRRSLTLFLRAPLPTGVRLFAVFEAGDFRDDAGNPNVAADSLSFTVASAIDYLPSVAGAWWQFARRWERTEGVDHAAGTDTVWVRHENAQVDGRFDRVISFDPGFAEIDDRMHFQLTSAALQARGFYDHDAAADIWFTPAVDYVVLPFQVRSWSGTATAGDMAMTFDGQILGRETLGFAHGEAAESLILENCWKTVINHDFGDGASTGADTLWWAPGLGLVQTHSSGTETGGSGTRVYWSRDRLVALDPFGD